MQEPQESIAEPRVIEQNVTVETNISAAMPIKQIESINTEQPKRREPSLHLKNSSRNQFEESAPPKVSGSLFNPPNPNATMDNFGAAANAKNVKLKSALDASTNQHAATGSMIEGAEMSAQVMDDGNVRSSLVKSGSVERFDKELTDKYTEGSLKGLGES